MKPKRLLYGVGTNDAGYVVEKWKDIGYVNGKRKQKRVWTCPYYITWTGMLKRCYSAKYQEKRPTYAGCTVAEEWHTFSVFKSWMQEQDFEDNQLDKDLLFEGNKVYSPETCIFVTGMANSFANDHKSKRGEWQIGASWNKERAKFLAQCRNPFTRKNEHLGYFTCEQEAHKAWRKRKLELAHELAAEQTDQRVAKALIDRYAQPMEKTE